MIESICQNCGNKKMFSEDKNGKKFKCPNCNEIVTIESIGTNITNTSQSNVTNSFSDSLRQAEEEKKRAEQKVHYDALMKKSRKWNGWAIALIIIGVISVIGSGGAGFLPALVWVGVGIWLGKKSKTFSNDAKRLYPLANTSVNTNDNNLGAILPQASTFETTKTGIVNIAFGGQWFLMDAKTKIFIENNLHSTHSTKEGFNAEIPITSSTLNIKVEIAGIKSTNYTLENLDPQKGYIMHLEYNETWGKYAKEFTLIELSKKV